MTEVNLKSLNKFIETFRKNKAEAEAKVAQIDEEYRRLAEEKKAELNKIISSCTVELEFWENNVLPRYSEQASFSAPEATADPEEVVVDTTADEGAQENISENDFPEEIPVEEEKIEPSVVVEEINVVEKMSPESADDFPNFEDDSATQEDKSTSELDDFWADTEDPWKTE